MTQNSTTTIIGAVTYGGTHVFRTQIDVAYTSPYYMYWKIVSFQNKVLFINTGTYNRYGLIVGINSTNQVVNVLTLDAGTFTMAY